MLFYDGFIYLYLTVLTFYKLSFTRTFSSEAEHVGVKQSISYLFLKLFSEM